MSTSGGFDTSEVSLARRAMTFERGVYSSLARWIGRRPDLGPAGTTSFSYVGIVRATILLWIWGSALEMAVVHFVVPWPVVRWILLIVSLWGLIWMVGYLAGLIVYPHLVEPDRVVVRAGHTIRAEIPAALIEGVHAGTRSLEHSRRVQLDPADPTHLFIAESGQVSVHLRLSAPITLTLPHGRCTVTRVSLWADDASGMVAAIRAVIS